MSVPSFLKHHFWAERPLSREERTKSADWCPTTGQLAQHTEAFTRLDWHLFFVKWTAS